MKATPTGTTQPLCSAPAPLIELLPDDGASAAWGQGDGQVGKGGPGACGTKWKLAEKMKVARALQTAALCGL